MQRKSVSDQPMRELYPDVLRTFAAVMVILIHVTTRYFSTSAHYGRPLWWVLVFINEITRIGVPLFFMLSGYLLLSGTGSDSILSFYKKRFSKLWLPFLWASAIYYLYYRVAAGEPVFDPAFIYQLLRGGTAYHLWYLYSIAMLYLFIPFFKMITDRCKDRCGIPALLVLLVLLTWQTTVQPLLNTIFSGFLYFNLTSDGVIGYFGYALLGYILGHYELSKTVRRIIFILGAISFVAFPLLLGNGIMTSGDYFWNGGYTINHYIEAAAVFLFAKKLFSPVYAGKHPAFTSAASYLSALTFPVYLIHVLVLEFVHEFTKPLLTGFTPGMILLLHAVLVTVISFGLSALWHTILHAHGLQKNRASTKSAHK